MVMMMMVMMMISQEHYVGKTWRVVNEFEDGLNCYGYEGFCVSVEENENAVRLTLVHTDQKRQGL